MNRSAVVSGAGRIAVLRASQAPLQRVRNPFTRDGEMKPSSPRYNVSRTSLCVPITEFPTPCFEVHEPESSASEGMQRYHSLRRARAGDPDTFSRATTPAYRASNSASDDPGRRERPLTVRQRQIPPGFQRYLSPFAHPSPHEPHANGVVADLPVENGKPPSNQRATE